MRRPLSCACERCPGRPCAAQISQSGAVSVATLIPKLLTNGAAICCPWAGLIRDRDDRGSNCLLAASLVRSGGPAPWPRCARPRVITRCLTRPARHPRAPGRQPRLRFSADWRASGAVVRPGGERSPAVPPCGARAAHAPAPPIRAAPAADAATSHRPVPGSSRHDPTVAATSSASDKAPAATHAPADPGWSAGRCSAASAPSPKATSRAPSARPKTRTARSSAAVPTQGRAGAAGQASAVSPSATRPAATAMAPRRSSGATPAAAAGALPPPRRCGPGRAQIATE